MKKFICAAAAFFIFANTAFGYGNVQYEDFNEYKSKYRILYGALLVIGGSLLAYDGFRTVRTDKSKPSFNMNFSSFWYTNTVSNNYVMKASGNIENTGNVKLKNVNIWARYKTVAPGGIPGGYQPSELGTKVNFDGISAGESLLLATGESKKWTHRAQYGVAGTNPPEGQDAGSEFNPDPDHIYKGKYPSSTPSFLADIVKVEYEYDKKYKEETNNAYEGVLWLLLIAGGAYLLIDYAASLKKFDYYMKKNHMNFYVENNAEEFRFMLSKKL